MNLRILTATLLALPVAGAQDLPDAGFLKVVNLVSLETPTFISLGSFAFDDGQPILAGEDSGLLALPPDDYTVTVSNEGAKPSSTSMNVKVTDGDNTVVMCYDESSERQDGTIVSKLAFATLVEEPAQDRPRLSIVSLLKQQTTPVRIDGETVILSDRRAHRIEPELNREISIQVDTTTLESIDIAKPIHYIAFLYRDPENGNIALSLIQNEKLEYHPPLPDEEEAEPNAEEGAAANSLPDEEASGRRGE